MRSGRSLERLGPGTVSTIYPLTRCIGEGADMGQEHENAKPTTSLTDEGTEREGKLNVEGSGVRDLVMGSSDAKE